MIGIFDSGVGGLSILHAIEATAPHEDIIYYADTAHFPYGEKSGAEILRYSSQITAFLFSKNIKLLVIACHSASVYALETLQKNFPIPILGMIEPTVKATPQGKIVLLTTEATLQSGVYQKAFSDRELITLSCPGLVRKVQDNDSETQALIRTCLAPILGKQIDALVLACSHYSFLLHEIEEELDPNTVVINPALSLAQEVKHTLVSPKGKDHKSKYTFYVSGDKRSFQNFLEKSPPKSHYEICSH